MGEILVRFDPSEAHTHHIMDQGGLREKVLTSIVDQVVGIITYGGDGDVVVTSHSSSSSAPSDRQVGKVVSRMRDRRDDFHLRNPCANCIQWINQYAFGYLHV